MAPRRRLRRQDSRRNQGGDLPVELPSKFELIINVSTAKALGLKITRALLQRADRIVQ